MNKPYTERVISTTSSYNNMTWDLVSVTRPIAFEKIRTIKLFGLPNNASGKIAQIKFITLIDFPKLGSHVGQLKDSELTYILKLNGIEAIRSKLLDGFPVFDLSYERTPDDSTNWETTVLNAVSSNGFIDLSRCDNVCIVCQEWRSDSSLIREANHYENPYSLFDTMTGKFVQDSFTIKVDYTDSEQSLAKFLTYKPNHTYYLGSNGLTEKLEFAPKDGNTEISGTLYVGNESIRYQKSLRDWGPIREANFYQKSLRDWGPIREANFYQKSLHDCGLIREANYYQKVITGSDLNAILGRPTDVITIEINRSFPDFDAQSLCPMHRHESAIFVVDDGAEMPVGLETIYNIKMYGACCNGTTTDLGWLFAC